MLDLEGLNIVGVGDKFIILLVRGRMSCVLMLVVGK